MWSTAGTPALVFAACVSLAPVVRAQTAPPASQVTIRSLEWAGSGCPPGSVEGSVASDAKAFSLLFSQYQASVGPGIPIGESRKNCNLLLRLKFPQGWSFTILNVDYRGYASLDNRVRGTQRSGYFFEGQFPSGALRSDLVGPFDDNYEVRDRLGLDTVVWSPCGVDRALNINTEVRVNNRSNPRGSGLITTDNITGELTHVYGLQWRRCP